MKNTNNRTLDMGTERRSQDTWFLFGVAFGVVVTLTGILFWLFLTSTPVEGAKVWKITAYCSCEKCCGKSDGITASGKKVQSGMVACNWLPFGTKVEIEGLGVFSVQDRGARKYFGGKDNHIKALDVYLPTHWEAKRFGVKHLEVEISK